jgi:hypothetical protein
MSRPRRVRATAFDAFDLRDDVGTEYRDYEGVKR